jgi:hypothetical protein
VSDEAPASLAALRALRDCGVVRARLQHPGFSSLFALGLAKMRPFPQHEGDQHPRRDFMLTTRGKAVANAVLK